tara:strand:+ start:1172 stop:1546 length:375 start_codon:yes stop_codon:yes gene_type:complete
MELKCEDYYFYPNGRYTTVSKWKSQLLSFNHDLQEISTAIRIFGTPIEINRALDEYINRTELNLDESYTYETEKKGSYWEEIVFSETRKDKPTLKEYNDIVNKKLKQYEDMYNQKKGALILNIN